MTAHAILNTRPHEHDHYLTPPARLTITSAADQTSQPCPPPGIEQIATIAQRYVLLLLPEPMGSLPLEAKLALAAILTKKSTGRFHRIDF